MLGSHTELWVKRDEASSSRYGGGKVRKLEYIFGASAPAEGGRVRSIGALGSHHLLALALHGERLGIGVDAVVAPQVVTPAAVSNLAVVVSRGARLFPVMDRMFVPMGVIRAHLRGDPGTMFLGPGGSNAAGCLGFVEAGLELAAQIAAGECPRPARIYVTAGTAGTGAGLVVGLTLGGVATHVRLISAVEPLYFNRWIFARKVATAWRAVASLDLREPRPTTRVDWSVDHSRVGGGYAVPTSSGRAAVAWGGDRGLTLETTYTGKCVAAALDDLRCRRVEGPVLIWNTHANTDLRPHIDSGWRQRLPPIVRGWVAGVPTITGC